MSEDWSGGKGAWRLELEQYDDYWTWFLYYEVPHDTTLTDGLVASGTTRNRQRAINKASKAQLRYAKHHIPKRTEQIEL